MRPFSFRQWVACAVMAAMLFNMAAPFVFCRCDECDCGHDVSRSISSFAIEADKPCHDSPVSFTKKECCGSSEMPCNCQCSDHQTNEPLDSKVVLSVQRPDVKPAWNIASVLPGSVYNASESFARFENYRTALPSRVPLHVLLCVFLN